MGFIGGGNKSPLPLICIPIQELADKHTQIFAKKMNVFPKKNMNIYYKIDSGGFILNNIKLNQLSGELPF